MAEAKAETANKKKRIKDEIQFIPSRIDEAERSKPNPVYVKGLEDEKKFLIQNYKVYKRTCNRSLMQKPLLLND